MSYENLTNCIQFLTSPNQQDQDTGITLVKFAPATIVYEIVHIFLDFVQC